MELVIDTNVLFSFFWKNPQTEKILFSGDVELYSPKFALTEILKHKNEILKRAKLPKEEFESLLGLMKQRVKFIPESEYAEFVSSASKLLGEHKKDADLIALSLKTGFPLWTRELKLKELAGVKVLFTLEIAKILDI